MPCCATPSARSKHGTDGESVSGACALGVLMRVSASNLLMIQKSLCFVAQGESLFIHPWFARMFFPVVYSVLGVWRESNSYAVPVEFQSDLPPQLAVESVELGEHVRCPEMALTWLEEGKSSISR